MARWRRHRRLKGRSLATAVTLVVAAVAIGVALSVGKYGVAIALVAVATSGAIWQLRVGRTRSGGGDSDGSRLGIAYRATPSSRWRSDAMLLKWNCAGSNVARCGRDN